MVRQTLIFVMGLWVLLAVGCSSKVPDSKSPSKNHSDHGHEHGGHAHSAIHGGALISLGQHFAHLEVVLDPKVGKLTIYVQDAEAEKAIRIKQEVIELKVVLSKDGKSEDVDLKCAAVESELSGEKAGDSSEFMIQSDSLKGLDRFEAVIKIVGVLGQDFPSVKFRYPEGNEG